jgi:RNA polymerase-binding transcription factor DksA
MNAASPFTSGELEEARSALENEGAHLLLAAQDHPADGWIREAATFEEELTRALPAPAQARFAEIRAALSRLDAGTFGQCVLCGGSLNPAEVRSQPWLSACRGCREAFEWLAPGPRRSAASGARLAA